MQNSKFRIQHLLLGLLVLVINLVLVPSAFAHVSVSPKEVGVGSRLNFVVGVPTEEDVPTTNLRLIIPEGLQSVRPNVKPGWTIRLVKSGEGEDTKVTEIVWSGGLIPSEQRDEFVFSAQAPANETSLTWKAYQTYADGLIVAWDADPKVVEEYTKTKQSFSPNNPQDGDDDHNAPKPYSVTKVVNDLAQTQAVINSNTETTALNAKTDNSSLVLTIALLALVLSGVSLALQFKAKDSLMSNDNKRK